MSCKNIEQLNVVGKIPCQKSIKDNTNIQVNEKNLQCSCTVNSDIEQEISQNSLQNIFCYDMGNHKIRMWAIAVYVGITDF